MPFCEKRLVTTLTSNGCAAPGVPPESTPSVMSWPDERGPDGDSSSGTLGAQKDAAGIWLWPNPVLQVAPLKSRLARQWGSRGVEQGQGLAALRRQQLFCHLRSCGELAGEEGRHKPLSSLQHQFKGFDSDTQDAGGSKGAGWNPSSTTAADAGSDNMQTQWNSVMNNIGRQDASSGMFIPGALRCLRVPVTVRVRERAANLRDTRPL